MWYYSHIDWTFTNIWINFFSAFLHRIDGTCHNNQAVFCSDILEFECIQNEPGLILVPRFFAIHVSLNI